MYRERVSTNYTKPQYNWRSKYQMQSRKLSRNKKIKVKNINSPMYKTLIKSNMSYLAEVRSESKEYENYVKETNY